MRTTTVVVPCYNEESRLSMSELVEFASVQEHIGLLLVDDGSSDRTASLLKELSGTLPEGLSSMFLEQNFGKAEAVRLGVQRVMGFDNVCFTGYWDADLATPLNTIPRFLELLENHQQLQLVMGARVKLLGRKIERSELRHYLGRVFATAASFTLRLPVYDTQCGAKVFRVNSLTRSAFQDPFTSKWIFDVEILARLSQSLALRGEPIEEAVYEYPLEQWIDVKGSKVKAKDYFFAMRELWSIQRRYFSGGFSSKVPR